MEKPKSQFSFKSHTSDQRQVNLFIQSEQLLLQGDWEWDMLCDHVFCSDVILSLPASFKGTVGIIHPDDISLVKERVILIKEVGLDIAFRIITTYGEIKTLSGRNISYTPVADNDLQQLESKIGEKALKERDLEKDAERLALHLQMSVFAESVTDTGTFYINSSTNVIYYSDEVFRIYGLPPQSLNIHFNTFTRFVHTSEREYVAEAMEKTFRDHLPLNLEFRIISADLKEKNVQLTTKWIDTKIGEDVLCGIMKDITEEKNFENKFLNLELRLKLQQGHLLQCEQVAGVGYWHINLQTRKTFFSDNLYKIFGLKPQSVPAGFSFFKDHVHPDDRGKVTEMLAKILSERKLPNLEHSIVRPDGKIRNVLHKGQFMQLGSEEIVTGVVYDVTNERRLEKKINDVNMHTLAKELALAHLEELSETAYWLHNLTVDTFTWSENLYRFIGYKPFSVQMQMKHITNSIHIDDRKIFTDALTVTTELLVDNAVEFRLVVRGEVKYVKASFKIMEATAGKILVASFVDHTTGILVRKQLEQRVELAEVLTENIEDAAIITDPDYNIVLWNKWSEHVYTFKRENVIGKNLFEIFPHLNNETDHQLFNRVLHGEKLHIPNRLSRVGKGYHNLTLVSVRKAGDFRGILHLLHTTTHEFELQQNLNMRLNFIEKILESSVDRIIALDRNFNFMIWNKKSEEYFNLKKAEVTGKNLLEIFPAMINDPLYDQFRKALRGDLVHIPASSSGRQASFFETYLIPVKDEMDGVNAVLWVVHDRTRELTFMIEQEKAQRILDTINEACLEVDENGLFNYVNNKAEELFGLDKKEVLGANFQSVFILNMQEPFLKAITGALMQKENSHEEYFSNELQQWMSLTATATKKGAILMFAEIQEIVEAREKLKTEHRRLKEAEALGRTGSFEWTVGDEEVSWSDELYRINGMEPQSEVITIEKVNALIHPDDVEELEKIKERSFKEPGLYKHVHKIVNRNGEVKCVSHQFESVADENGKVVRVHGTLLDITEQQRTDIILDSVNEVCFEVDKDFNLRYANRIAYNLWKKTPDEVIGKNIWSVLPGYADSAISDALITSIEEKKQVLKEAWFAAEDKWIFVSVNPSITGLIVLYFDITEQKKALRQVQEKNDLLQGVLSAPNIYIIVCKAIRDEGTRIIDFSFLLASRQSKKVSGRYNLVGSRYCQLFSPSPGHFARLVKVVETNEIIHEELEMHVDGKNCWFRSSYAKFDDGFINTWADITDRKKTEVELFRSGEIIRATLDSSHQMIEALEAVRNEQHDIIDFRWILANDIALQFHGPIVGTSLLSRYPDATANGLFANYKSVTETGERLQFQMNYNRKNSQSVFNISVVKMDDGLVSTSENVSR